MAGEGNGENRPSKDEFDSRRLAGSPYRDRRIAPEPIDVISKWIWGGPGVVGAEEKFRAIDSAKIVREAAATKEHRNIWIAIVVVLALTNPIIGHFVLQWFGWK